MKRERKGSSVAGEMEAAATTECPWCKREYDKAHRMRSYASPCGHEACLSCFRASLLLDGGDKTCKTCSVEMTRFGFVKPPPIEVEAEPKKSKNEEAAAVELASQVIAEPLTIEELRTAVLPGDNYDWICAICQFYFDNDHYVPVYVSVVSARPRNRYAPEEENLDEKLPGCGHRVCSKCASDVIAKGLACSFCRANVREFEPDAKLLTEIVAFQDGHYVALVRQLNEAMWRNVPLEGEVRALKDSFEPSKKTIADLRADVEALRKDKRQKDDLEALIRDERRERDAYAANVKSLTETAKEAQADARAFKSQIKSISAINEALFNELIDTRLRQVGAGMLDPQQLGLAVTFDPLSSKQKATVQIAIGPPHRRTATLVYGCNPQRMGLAGANMIDQIAQYMDAAASSSIEVNLPETEQDVRDGIIPLLGGSCVMVQRGSWLYRYVSSTEQTPEGLFDSDLLHDNNAAATVDMQSMYRPVSTSVVNQAIKEWKNLADARKKKREVAVAVAVESTDLWFCRETTCWTCFDQRPPYIHCGYCDMYHCPVCDSNSASHRCPKFKTSNTVSAFYGEGMMDPDNEAISSEWYFAASVNMYEFRVNKGRTNVNREWSKEFVDAFAYWCITNMVPGSKEPPYPNVSGVRTYRQLFSRVWLETYRKCAYPCGIGNATREFYYAQCRALLAFAKIIPEGGGGESKTTHTASIIAECDAGAAADDSDVNPFQQDAVVRRAQKKTTAAAKLVDQPEWLKNVVKDMAPKRKIIVAPRRQVVVPPPPPPPVVEDDADDSSSWSSSDSAPRVPEQIFDAFARW